MLRLRVRGTTPAGPNERQRQMEEFATQVVAQYPAVAEQVVIHPDSEEPDKGIIFPAPLAQSADVNLA